MSLLVLGHLTAPQHVVARTGVLMAQLRDPRPRPLAAHAAVTRRIAERGYPLHSRCPHMLWCHQGVEERYVQGAVTVGPPNFAAKVFDAQYCISWLRELGGWPACLTTDPSAGAQNGVILSGGVAED